jgi:hypothetical protein
VQRTEMTYGVQINKGYEVGTTLSGTYANMHVRLAGG